MHLRRRANRVIQHELSQIEWNNIVKTLDNPNTAYESLFDTFFKTYDKYFPKVSIKIKAKGPFGNLSIGMMASTSAFEYKYYLLHCINR